MILLSYILKCVYYLKWIIFICLVLRLKTTHSVGFFEVRKRLNSKTSWMEELPFEGRHMTPSRYRAVRHPVFSLFFFCLFLPIAFFNLSLLPLSHHRCIISIFLILSPISLSFYISHFYICFLLSVLFRTNPTLYISLFLSP